MKRKTPVSYNTHRGVRGHKQPWPITWSHDFQMFTVCAARTRL